MFSFRKRATLPSPAEALPGRQTALPTAERHFVNGRPLKGRIQTGTRASSSGSAASGARSASSGACPACG